MPRIDPAILAWLSPLWIAIGSAASLALIAALAFGRSRKGVLAATGRMLVALAVAGLCGLLTWALVDTSARRDRTAEHTALAARAEQLAAQALTPGSPLACLDAMAGEIVETACQKALFDSPVSVASAVSYVSAQFALFSDMADYLSRGGNGIDTSMTPLRRALEADAYGILAHILALRDGCTGERCPALALLRNPGHVRTNLIAHTFDRYVEQYREAWARSPESPAADLASAQPTGAFAPNTAGKRKVMVNIDFPSAASIPPISIMNPEPAGPAVPRAAGAGGEPHKRAERPPAHAVPDEARTDPVWTPAPAAPAR